MLWPPADSVKHSCQKIPDAPLREPVVVLLPAQFFVSGYLPLKKLSTVSLFCWALCAGLDAPLPTVTEPSPFGLLTVMLSSSLLSTVQPRGRMNVSPLLDAVGVPAGVGVGEAAGLGVPPGLGLGRMPVELPWLPARFPRTAIAVPHPAMSTTRTTIALMISIHGVRCTDGCGPTALGA